MPMSPRAKLFLAFVLMAGVMGTVTVLSSITLRDQVRQAAEVGQRQETAVDAMAVLRAITHEAQGLVQAHLSARTGAEKSRIAAELLAADTREALALARLATLAQGAEAALVADLSHQVRQAADLRQRVVSISARNALGRATDLATIEMPGLRAELIAGLRVVAAQTGKSLVASEAEAALNALAAAQKNALLRPEPANITGQLTAAALAHGNLVVALQDLALEPSPGLAPLQAMVAELGLMDQEIEALLRDGADETASAIFADQLRPLDRQRLETLDSLAALFQTGRRAIEAAAQETALGSQMTLVVLADLALILGFGAVTLALSRIGRGLEGAVRLAEQMAGDEVLPAAWVHGNLSGRLTSALVRISAGQTAVLASLDALGQGRAPRSDLPERLRQRFAALAMMTAPGGGTAQVEAAAQSAQQLQETLRHALADGRALQDETGRIVALVQGPRPLEAGAGMGAPLTQTAEHIALCVERQVTALIHAETQATTLLQVLGPQPSASPAPLRRIA
ncbi:hypothetical protein [Stagnihabitans tardus]|uniref:Uncharacterized protein n=1 Tax=Stagnihabitans tardus TaxID=2699202 RepID=A0AAE4Y8N1_9RHOB|nr:hypothetical protein [Stagnihabitans tardus]NBZ88021.1 hypothetical protein [Stagnihabitans tardus]